MKRIWSILLALALAAALALPAAAAENTATTMRLMETEGTVAAENSAGQALSLWDGMRLYSGYQVATEAASYAYIALDNSKTAKLDASSAAKVAQSGKQLELNATAGSLFFNVPVALKSGESMNIRTSTMVTGIRGTSGWVRVLDRYTTRVALLEGTVTIHSRDPLTGANRSVTIHGGQIATIILHEKAAAMTQQLIDQGVIIEENIVEDLTRLGQVVEELQEDNVPGFVAAEVAKDPELQQRINQESPLDAQEIAKNAPQKLAADEAAAAAEAKKIQQQLDNISAKETGEKEEVFTKSETIIVTETETIIKEIQVEVPGETIREEVPVLDTDSPTAKEVQDSLNKTGVATATKADLDLADFSVGAGQVLNIVSGTLTNSGDSTVDGTINIFADAELVNEDTLAVTSTNSIHVYGTLTNNGVLTLGGTDSGKLVVQPGGKLVNNGDIRVKDSSSLLEVKENGTLENRGNINFSESDKNFVMKGLFKDYKNEIFSQDDRSGAVTYLGSFADIAENPRSYSGKTFKLLNAGTLTAYTNIKCTENTALTLDLNGNSADVVGIIEGASTTTIHSTLLFGGYGGDFTLTDSVGGGELKGSLLLKEGAHVVLESGTINGFVLSGDDSRFEMTGGTLVVPSYDEEDVSMHYAGFREYCAGISVYGGGFYMTGGTIDASANDTCALDAPYEYIHLESGILIGQNLLPESKYVSVNSMWLYGYDYVKGSNYSANFEFLQTDKDYQICLSESDRSYDILYPILLCYRCGGTSSKPIFRCDMVVLIPLQEQ